MPVINAEDLPFEPLPRFQPGRFVDDNGNLTPEMQFYNDQLNRVLLTLISRYGWQLPVLTTDEIEYVSSYTPTGVVNSLGVSEVGIPVGTIWFNSSIGKVQVKTSLDPRPIGTIETLMSVVDDADFMIAE